MYVFCKYFLQICGLSSHSLRSVFHRTEVFNFNEVQLINYFFHGSCLLCCILKCHYHNQDYLDFLLSSRIFIVLHFTFRFIIHFELIFVKSLKSVSRFIWGRVDVHLFQHHLLKRLSFLHCLAFTLLSRISWLYLSESVYGFSILFHWSIFIFLLIPLCLDYYSCVIIFKVV